MFKSVLTHYRSRNYAFENALFFSREPTHTPIYDLKYKIKREPQANSTAMLEDVIIEMQRKPESFYIVRTQNYLAHSLFDNLPHGKGAIIPQYICKCYALVIAEKNIFHDTTRQSFHTVVTQIDSQTNLAVEHNVMDGHYYELDRFSKLIPDVTLNGDFSIQLKWLHFIHKCSDYDMVPQGAPDIFVKAFKLMEIGSQMTTIDSKEAAIRLEDKVETLGAIRLLKLKGCSEKEILSAFGRMFRQAEVNYVLSFLDSNPGCSSNELAMAFKSFSGYPY